MDQPQHLAPGQIVGGGRYELRRLLGRGGMGMVWLAYDARLKEEVALKFLPPEISADVAALDSMRLETLRSRRLTHPHIVRIHDLSEALDETPFISMEYIEGANLNELRLQSPGKVLTWDFLAPLVQQLCHALDYAHNEGVIHRDLKPGNLMVDAKGRLKLTDFGIAAVMNNTTRRNANSVSGTPGYMSPQQMRGQIPTESDDVYSLGATVYELLTGRPPFYSGDIAHQVLHVEATPIEQRLWELGTENDIPTEVTALILSCLAKDPAYRPPNARTLGSWFNLGAGAPPPSPATIAPAADPAQKNNPPILAILGGLAITGLVIGILWARQQAGQKQPAIAPVAQEQAPTPNPVANRSEEWVTILGGKTLLGWEGDRQFWSIREGAITGQAPAGWKGRYMRYLVWSEGTVKNFELKFQFRMQNTPNSGVLYRATPDGVGGVSGYQFEIWKEKTGNLMDVGGDKPRRDLALRGEDPHPPGSKRQRSYRDGGVVRFGRTPGGGNSSGRLERSGHPRRRHTDHPYHQWPTDDRDE